MWIYVHFSLWPIDKKKLKGLLMAIVNNVLSLAESQVDATIDIDGNPAPASQPSWINIDESDGRDHLTCAHIANDIMNNLFRAEVRMETEVSGV